MGVIKFSTVELENVIDGRYHSFVQDIADGQHTVGSPQAITGGVEYPLTIDALERNAVVSPTYITSRWDAVNDKIAFPEELNTPMYTADISFTFDPTVSAAGDAIIRAYIDDSITPKVIRSISHQYKADPESINAILSWYLGEEAGYDAKNDGVYFTVEFEADGVLYNKGAVIYRS